MARKKQEVVVEVDGNPSSLMGMEVVEAPAGEVEQAASPAGVARPKMSDPGWHDYVMQCFTPNELVKGNPRVNAIWRVTELLLGPIVEYSARVVKAPENMHDRCAAVEASVGVYPQKATELPQTVCRYSGTADSIKFNTDEKFAKYAVCCAETRAKGRALRTALRLHRAVAAEEIAETPAAFEADPLTAAQIAALDAMGRTANVNVLKFVAAECRAASIDVKRDYGSVRNLPKDFGVCLCKRLTEIQASGNTPSDLAGYQPNWRGDE